MKAALVTLALALSVSLSTGCSTDRGRWDRSPQSVNPGLKIVYGENYLTELYTLLDSATTTVDILMFNFASENGEVRKIADRLVNLKATRPQLRIRVLMEGELDLLDKTGKPNPKSVASRNQLTKTYLEKLAGKDGITVQMIRGLRAPGVKEGVNHAKAVCVDRRVVLAGSTNWTNTSLQKNNELNARVESPILAAKFTEYFESLMSDSSKMISMTERDGSVIFLTDLLYYEMLLKLLKGAVAGDTLDLQMYYFAYRPENDGKPNEDKQAKALYEEIFKAHQRGVKVRLFLERNGDSNVSPEVTAANLKVAQTFYNAGFKDVYLDLPQKISHTKMAIYNQRVVLLGSSNWYGGDFNENHQINWIIRDLAQVKDLTSYFNKKLSEEGVRYTAIPSSSGH